MNWNSRLPFGRGVASHLAALLAGSALVLVPAAKGADMLSGPAHAEAGQSISTEARVVQLDAMPQADPMIAGLASPRPRGGVDEAQYQARKAAAARQVNAAGVTPGGAAYTQQPQGVHVDTPGAKTVFAGLGESGGVYPSDMAIAVSDKWVVQVVNSRIAVYNKSGTIQSGFPKARGRLLRQRDDRHRRPARLLRPHEQPFRRGRGRFHGRQVLAGCEHDQ
jgi:hypothetical protein